MCCLVSLCKHKQEYRDLSDAVCVCVFALVLKSCCTGGKSKCGCTCQEMDIKASRIRLKVCHVLIHHRAAY